MIANNLFVIWHKFDRK